MADDDETDDTVVTETDDADDDGLDDDTETTPEATADATTDSSTAGITPKQMAKNHLRKANKKENTGSITLVGDTSLVGGVTVDTLNFGAFSLKYIVSKATHKVTNSGYDVDIEIRKCLDNY